MAYRIAVPDGVTGIVVYTIENKTFAERFEWSHGKLQEKSGMPTYGLHRALRTFSIRRKEIRFDYVLVRRTDGSID